MTARHRDELLLWIQQLNRRCLELNTALIRANKLDELAELADWEPFSWPGRAVRAGVIPRRGSLNFDGQQTNYALHGTGITFNTVAGEEVSFEYFPQPLGYRGPLLGLWSIQQFIGSVEPANIFITNGILDETLDNLFTAGKVIRVLDGYSQFYLRQSE